MLDSSLELTRCDSSDWQEIFPKLTQFMGFCNEVKARKTKEPTSLEQETAQNNPRWSSLRNEQRGTTHRTLRTDLKTRRLAEVIRKPKSSRWFKYPTTKNKEYSKGLKIYQKTTLWIHIKLKLKTALTPNKIKSRITLNLLVELKVRNLPIRKVSWSEMRPRT